MLKGLPLATFVVLVASGGVALAGDVLGSDFRAILKHQFHSLDKEIFGKNPEEEKDEAFVAQNEGGWVSLSALSKGSNDDYFAKMDYGITLPENKDELLKRLQPFFGDMGWKEARNRMARGRDNWIVWTFGNDRFWSYMTRSTLGGLDFLKTISDYDGDPNYTYYKNKNYPHNALASIRSNRWMMSGLVNEPCYDQATGPNKDRWGLWIPKRIKDKDCADRDPFEDDGKYPGVKLGARGETLDQPVEWDAEGKVTKTVKTKFPVGSFYGYATGIIGLRLFPNPDFTQAEADKWNPERFYNDYSYFTDPNVVRPYRVGMSCAFCHVGPNPSRPPADFEHPKMENLNSNPGAQYWWVDRIFDWNWDHDQDSFIYQLLHTSRPGTVDTSLVSSDMINNPRTMNAVYDLPARVIAAVKFNHLEFLKGDENLNAQFAKFKDEKIVPHDSPLVTALNTGDPSKIISPRVLKDGSDSVGALGALNRVYINIGLFSEEWIHDFIPVIGGPYFTPFSIELANRRSLYWQANVAQTPDLALFFIASTKKSDSLKEALQYNPQKLPDAPKYKVLSDNDPVIEKGKLAYAKYCVQCHSSKQPDMAYKVFTGENCVGEKYLPCWDAYWKLTKTKEYKSAVEDMVMKDSEFFHDNFMSTDLRVPSTIIDSQLCSPVATNAIRGDTWDNFSSDSYKNMLSVGQVSVSYPMPDGTMRAAREDVPGGGRGFLRPASLISVWSSAPFLQNNSLGKFHWEGTVKARLDSYDDAIEKLLNPLKRGDDADLADGKKAVKFTNSFVNTLIPGVIDVTTSVSFLKIPRGYLPKAIFNKIKEYIDKSPPEYKMEIRKVANHPHSWRDTMVAKKNDTPKRKPAWFGFGSGPSQEQEDLSAYVDPEQAMDVLYLGPFPKGTPVNLISNIDLAYLRPERLAWIKLPGKPTLLDMTVNLIETFVGLRKRDAVAKKSKVNNWLESAQALDYFMRRMDRDLLTFSKCRDFVVNRGHYFGTEFGPPNRPDGGRDVLTEDEKQGLKEFLKTL